MYRMRFQEQMANWYCILLLFATLVSGSFDVMRTDDGDFFNWHAADGNKKSRVKILLVTQLPLVV